MHWPVSWVDCGLTSTSNCGIEAPKQIFCTFWLELVSIRPNVTNGSG